MGGSKIEVATEEEGFAIAFERTTGRVPVDASSLRKYEACVRSLAAVSDGILPMRWGSFVSDLTELRQLLEPHRAKLRAALDLVSGREQMSLRLFRRKTVDDGVTDVPGHAWAQCAMDFLRHASSECTSDGPGTRYLRERALLAQGADSDSVLEDCLGELNGHVLAARARRDPSGKLFTAYHLIPRGGASGYCASAAQLEVDLERKGWSFHLSGPWPPYAFVPELW